MKLTTGNIEYMINASQAFYITPTLLDRLTNAEPNKTTEQATPAHKQILQWRESIRRDLENLLNTRRPQFSWPKNMHELNNSLLAYGIVSIVGKSLADSECQKRICQQIKAAIQQFEQRIKDVKVLLIEGDHDENKLKLRIEGVLLIETVSELIAFDTIIEPERHNRFVINSAEK